MVGSDPGLALSTGEASGVPDDCLNPSKPQKQIAPGPNTCVKHTAQATVRPTQTYTNAQNIPQQNLHPQPDTTQSHPGVERLTQVHSHSSDASILRTTQHIVSHAGDTHSQRSAHRTESLTHTSQTLRAQTHALTPKHVNTQVHTDVPTCTTI